MQTPDVVVLVPGFLGFSRFGGFQLMRGMASAGPTAGAETP